MGPGGGRPTGGEKKCAAKPLIFFFGEVSYRGPQGGGLGALLFVPAPPVAAALWGAPPVQFTLVHQLGDHCKE